jgi:hypothetical protein
MYIAEVFLFNQFNVTSSKQLQLPISPVVFRVTKGIICSYFAFIQQTELIQKA